MRDVSSVMGIERAVHTDVPVTLAVVAISSLVLLGDFVTNPVDDCTVASLHGPWSAAATRTEVLITDPAQGRRRQQGDTQWDPYAQTDPYETSNPNGPYASAPSATSTQWELAEEFEAKVGCGLNAWLFTCYPHAYYNQFSMTFLPRLFAWSFGHTSFETYKINMLFMLVLGAQAEAVIKWEHMAALLLSTTVIGGLFALSTSGSALIGSSALIFAVMLVLPAETMWPIKSEGVEKSPRSREDRDADCTRCLVHSRNLFHEKHLAHFCVSALFVFGEASLSFGEVFGDLEEDGISQFGHMLAGILGVLIYITVLRHCPCMKREEPTKQYEKLQQNPATSTPTSMASPKKEAAKRSAAKRKKRKPIRKRRSPSRSRSRSRSPARRRSSSSRRRSRSRSRSRSPRRSSRGRSRSRSRSRSRERSRRDRSRSRSRSRSRARSRSRKGSRSRSRSRSRTPEGRRSSSRRDSWNAFDIIEFTSASEDITISGATAKCERGIRKEGTAVCKDPKMNKGKHYAEFTLIKGASCTLGVCRSSLDPRDTKLACTTNDAWGYSVRSGFMHHGTARATNRWTGQKAGREGMVIGMLLDMDLGTLAVYHDGVKIGDLVRTGLKYLDLVWMVQLVDGSEVRVEKKDPPSATTAARTSSYSSPRDTATSRYSSTYGTSTTAATTEDVRTYMKRVGLDAWFDYFDKHLPSNMTSVRTLRGTTGADLRRMATKANMRLDAKTTQQVLDALKKP